MNLAQLLFTFKGRINRKPWWLASLAVEAISSLTSGLVALVIGIWLFIEIGFLKGTQGPNRFGPDPLGAARDDAKL